MGRQSITRTAGVKVPIRIVQHRLTEAGATGSFPGRPIMTIQNLGNEAMSVEPGRSVLSCIWDVDLSEPCTRSLSVLYLCVAASRFR